MTRCLLTAGAKPDVADGAGYAPLHRAAAAGDVDTVKLLLGAGANVDLPGPGGKTAIQLADEARRGKMVYFLKTSARALCTPL